MRLNHVKYIFLFAASISNASAQTADFSLRFTDYSLGTDERVFFTDYSFDADEKWYLGSCTDQLSPADRLIRAVDYSFDATLKVYLESYAAFADTVVCVKGPVPDVVRDKLR